MTTDQYGQWMGTPMDDDAVENLLASAGWGVLSLANDDEPYSIPVSFGYTGDAVYFAFVRADPPNTKFDFVADGDTARLLVTDVRARFDWQSVAVTGPVSAVERDDDLGGEGLLPELDRSTARGGDWDALLNALAGSPWFSPEYEHADAVSALQGWRLDPERVRGVEVGGD